MAGSRPASNDVRLRAGGDPAVEQVPRLVALAAAAALVLSLLPLAAAAQEDTDQVTGLTVEQHHGFAALRWTPVEGANEYQIERTVVNEDDEPIGSPTIVGLWRPQRQINQHAPSFADSGFAPGLRYRWRVRAVLSGAEFSEPVTDDSMPTPGPEEFLTEFETSGATQFTSYASEIDWTYRIAEASERVRVVTIGHTVQGREINAFIIGYPAPPETAEEVSAAPSAGSNCNVHGNEPSGREGCFMMIRELAFSDEEWVIDILSNANVLIVPSINGDGRASNSRGNVTGQDLNRDYGRLTQPETQALIRFWRDYTPEVMNDGHEFGNTGTCDLPLMATPQLQNSEATYHEAKVGLIEGWMYDEGAADGWWPCPYPITFSPGGQSFGNTAGMKHIIGMLTEARSQGGPTRPNSGGTNSQAQRRRKAYSQLWTIRQVLDYHRQNLPRIQQAIADSIAFQTSNTGRIVFDGTHDWPAFPPPHPGQNPPPPNIPGPGDVLEEPPCGYLISPQQYTTPLADGGSLPVDQRTTAEQRLGFHGIEVEDRPAGHLVRMAQSLRALIPLILDGQAQSVGIPIIVAAQRLDECPHAAVGEDHLAATAVEGTQASLPLTVSNLASEPDEELDWSITEAATDCAEPSDLGWLSVDPAEGTTPSSSSTEVTVTFDASGLRAPETREGVLCLSSNDPGDPVIAVEVSLQVRYPMSGFQAPVAAPPALNPVTANQSVPVKFSLDGDRGPAFLASGSPASRPVDCAALAPTGPAEPTETAGGSALAYDAASDTYTYVWTTSRAWSGSCREFVLTLDDGSEHTAYFDFR